MERFCQSLVAIPEEKEKVVQSAKAGIVKEERAARSENLENVKEKKRVTPGRKEEKNKLEKNFPINRSKKLYPSVSSHHQMKVMMTG